MVGCNRIMMACLKKQDSHRSASMKSTAVGMILATQWLAYIVIVATLRHDRYVTFCRLVWEIGAMIAVGQ